MNREVPLPLRLGRVLLIVGGLVAGVVIAVTSGAVKLPSFDHSSTSASPSSSAAAAAARTAADKQWASALCTNLLDWKNEIKRDGTSLSLSFGPGARVNDAAAATTRLLRQLGRLGLPPGQTPQARAEAEQLRAEITSRASQLAAAAGSVASGNLTAIGSLLSDLAADRATGTQIATQLQRVVSVDLGLSLAETSACRQLVGIPV